MGTIHKQHQRGGGPSLRQAVRRASTKSLQSRLTLQRHGLPPTRLSCPWDSLGRNTGWELPFPPPGALPSPGIKPRFLMSPALAGEFITTSPIWEAQTVRKGLLISWFDGLYENTVIKWWRKFSWRSHLRHHCETRNVMEFRLDLLGNRQLLENMKQERRRSECLLKKNSRKHRLVRKICCMCCAQSHPTLCPRGLQSASLLCSWHFPGKNTGVACHFLLQGVRSRRQQK